MVFECKTWKWSQQNFAGNTPSFDSNLGNLVYFSDISENTRPKVTLMVDFVGF